VQGDGTTLPERLEETLLRAGFLDGDALATLVVESLTDAQPRHRILALRAGWRRHLLDPDHWINALGDLDDDVRREAVSLLAYEAWNDSRMSLVMIALLSDPDALVVDGAAFALGEHQVVGAVEPLIDVATRHDDARCREAAIAALGSIGDDRARAAIIAALDDKPPVRRRAIVALANFEGPDIDAALSRASNDRDWQVRSAVDQLTREDDD
jgi:HEAT repeat protein